MQEVNKKYNFVEATQKTIIEKKGLFINKSHRDEIATYLKNQGLAVKKSTLKNQRLHPEYLNDYEGSYNTGFGNSDYLRTWTTLYKLSF